MIDYKTIVMNWWTHGKETALPETLISALHYAEETQQPAATPLPLAAFRALAEKWRKPMLYRVGYEEAPSHDEEIHEAYDATRLQCADELEALINGK